MKIRNLIDCINTSYILMESVLHFLLMRKKVMSKMYTNCDIKGKYTGVTLPRSLLNRDIRLCSCI